MKTIEEINEIAPYHPLEWQEGYGIWQDGFMEGQKSAAAEQKEIDIDKACEWLNEQLYTDDGGCLASVFYQQLDDFLVAFRKAMEE